MPDICIDIPVRGHPHRAPARKELAHPCPEPLHGKGIRPGPVVHPSHSQREAGKHTPLEEPPKRRWGGGAVKWRGRFRLQRDVRNRHHPTRRSHGQQRSQGHRLNGAVPEADDYGDRLPGRPSMPVGPRAVERGHQQGRIGLTPRACPGKPVLGWQEDDDQGKHERDPPLGSRTGRRRGRVRRFGGCFHRYDDISRAASTFLSRG